VIRTRETYILSATRASRYPSLTMARSRVICAATLSLLLSSSVAFAQAKGVAQVINVDSDDAEDQADAFTGALKSRARAAGWGMLDTPNALGPLLTALKCPSKPDAACLGRVGEQLKVERFFWGTMSKSSGKSVTVELHLWSKGKPDQTAKETFSENLKDQNDEALRKIAQRMFDKLAGSATPPPPPPPIAGPKVVVTIKANVEDGAVFVDGQEVGKLEKGQATIEVGAGGAHDIEVRAPGYAPAKQSVNATAATSVTLELVSSTPPPPTGPSKPFPVWTVVGVSTMGLGVVAGVIGLVEGLQFIDLQGQNAKDHTNTSYQGVKDFCKDPPAGPNSDPCRRIQSANTAQTMEFLFFGIGGALVVTGAVMVLVAPRGSKTEEAPAVSKVRVVPSFGPNGGGLTVGGAF
jgi:hypothetical protein